ncbi:MULTISPECIES: IclR family transcriptional regulator [Enterococcus]|uniref:IclR family transcriptional regulator n=1 Tax=Enterococcus TaxID=1350 RepID=UPI0010FA24B7|nr:MULTISPECIES: IclR family transcriptional regulator [Enterococcus]KAF1301001.1 IclR family transcriptional regulator [Enterococcus sp. JM9B]
MENSKPYGTVLIRAAHILDYLADHPDLSLQQLSRGTEMTASTTLKILDTLVLIGYVNKNQDKTYRLGSKLIRYANKNIDQLDLVELSLPYLEQLQKSIDETIHLGILNNAEILYVNKLEPKNQTIRMSSKIGITRPLYSSAMGKAVLSEFSESDYQDYLNQHELVAYTEHTITNSLKLASELNKTKESKVAYDDEEMEKDIFCIGAAIMNQEKIIGAFSVSMPKYRLNSDTEEKIITKIKETKTAIEKEIAKVAN